jgi:murein DD-endopeptidase MepM/ murein hydrolase activator NlpD
LTWKHPFDKKTITSRFGETARRTSPHRGLDYAPGSNALIGAVTSGKVELIQWSDCLGWVMVQSCNSRKYFIGYSHLSCYKHGENCKGIAAGCKSPFKSLKVGQRIAVGQSVGRVGNTGECSRGAHLHLTLGKHVKHVFTGKVIDPETYIDKQQVEICKTCKQEIKK